VDHAIPDVHEQLQVAGQVSKRCNQLTRPLQRLSKRDRPHQRRRPPSVSTEADDVQERVEVASFGDQARVSGDEVRLREVLQGHGAMQHEESCIIAEERSKRGTCEPFGRLVELVLKTFRASHASH
jgi:hypothetical protein